MLRILILALLLLCGVGQTKVEVVLCSVRVVKTHAILPNGFYTLTAQLNPSCPSDGQARVSLGQYGASGSEITGPIEILNKQRPSIIWKAQPWWRTVLWYSQSGKPYMIKPEVR